MEPHISFDIISNQSFTLTTEETSYADPIVGRKMIIEILKSPILKWNTTRNSSVTTGEGDGVWLGAKLQLRVEHFPEG